ncbi:dTMP kinase, partial [Salmonella enterica]|uniref:dTMP kinase n=1 Tax=Salmonella enterica TaxID=28901 RepID=UPI003EDC043D
PALTLLLDCPVEAGLRRAIGDDRFHREDLAFHQRVRDGFLAQARQSPAAFVVIDASRDSDQVHSEVAEAVSKCLNR